MSPARSAPALLALALSACAASPRPTPPPPTACTGDSTLPAARERAVLAGAHWLAAYLADPAHLADLGSDGPAIFLELGETSPSPAVREVALAEARRLAALLLPRLVAPGALADRDELFHAVSLLADAEALGIAPEALGERVRAGLAAWAAPAAFYGAATDTPAALSADALFYAFVNAYGVDKLALDHPWAAPARALDRLLPFVRDRPYVAWAADGPAYARFWDDFYLATHVFFVLGDYGRLRVDPRRAPAVWDYLRAQLPAAMALRSVDLVAELVEVWRLAGHTEGDDPLLCEGAHFLVAAQHDDGSWGDWRHEERPYFAAHPTWTAVHALRDRRPLGDTLFARRLAAILSTPPR